jgi:site-specific DNA recombinase
MTAFALYACTSTDDLQDPADSLRWQTDTAFRLVAGHGEIAAIYHDIDSSRSLPWERRPQATRILADARNPHRGWDALVIAEPQRAFSGAQFDSVVNVLHHFGVELWVPELGGRFDADNDGHWMMLANFGVLSRAERNRTPDTSSQRHASPRPSWPMAWWATALRLSDSRRWTPPQPSKAASGARLHQLEPDPETAPVVERIFSMYLAGSGFKAIATVLTTEGVPSPSAADAARNTHRPGHAWAFSAVRAILQNPRYLGRHVFGKQAKAEVLLDPDQPGLGHVTRMRWQDRSEWQTATDVTHEPLVDETRWQRVQQLIESNGRPSRTPRMSGGASRRSAPSRYPLAGLITCDHCRKKLQGSHTRGLAFCRCRIGTGYPVGPAGHPLTLAVREDRLLPHLDAWLSGLFAPERVEAVAREVAHADAESRRGTRRHPSPDDPGRLSAQARSLPERPRGGDGP